MTPGQARIALLSFLLVTTGVVVNAHFLQKRSAVAASAAIERQPMRVPPDLGKASETLRTDRSNLRAPNLASGEHPLRIARFAPDSARLDGVPATPTEDASAKTIGAIQRELTARGYGPLAEDGAIGLETQAAIMAFEQDHGLAVTGEASERLLQHVLFGASAGIDAAGGANARSAPAEQVIRMVQQRLVALGYPVGRVDGRLGEETVEAIRNFEMDKGLVPKGRISAELVARLGVPAAPKSASR